MVLARFDVRGDNCLRFDPHNLCSLLERRSEALKRLTGFEILRASLGFQNLEEVRKVNFFFLFLFCCCIPFILSSLDFIGDLLEDCSEDPTI